MADLEFRGDALPLSEITEVYVERYLPGGVYGLRIYNLPEIQVVAPADLPDESVGVAKLLAQQIVLAGLSAKAVGNKVTIEGPQATTLGIRIRATPNCYVQNLRLGLSPTAKQIKVTLPEGATGGTWSLTFNFGAGAETATLNADSDLGDMEAAIEALPSVGTGEVTVSVLSESPFTYLISIGGSQLGKDWAVSANGAGLIGVASVKIRTVQIASPVATCIQAFRTGTLTYDTHGVDLYHAALGVRFSRGGVTSHAALNLYATTRNINSPEGWKTFIEDVPNSSIVSAAITAALAEICGTGKVTWRAWMRDGGLTLVVKWIERGAQEPITMEFSNPNGNLSSITWYTATTEVVRADGANQNEILLLPFSSAQNPDFTVTITKGATSFTIAQRDTHATLQTKWEAAFGSGNVLVHAKDMVEFTGSMANIDQEAITYQYSTSLTFTDNHGSTTIPAGTNFNAVVLSNGMPLQNEIQEMVVYASGGTFPVSSDGTNYTSDLAWNLSADALETSLQGLAAIGSGNCSVTGAGTPVVPFLIEYIGDKALTDMPLLKADADQLTGGPAPTVATAVSPKEGTYQIDQIWLDPNLNGGYLMPIRDNLFGNRVVWNGDAAAWEAAIEAIPSSSCTVTGSGKPFLVTWASYGPKNFDINQDNATVSVSSLLRLVRVRESTGPNYFNQAKNWSGERVPSCGDRLILRDGRQSINEGLMQRCHFTVDTGTGDLIMGTDVTNSGDFVAGQGVYLSTEGAFPTATLSGSPLTIHDDVVYYVTGIDKLSRRLQLSTTQGGVGIEFTNQGTGVHTVEVELLDYQHHKTYSGAIGLPRRSNGRLEEKPRWLEIASQNVDISLGDQGTGSSLQNLSLGKRLSKVNQYGSAASGQSGEYATNIRARNTGTDIWGGGGNLAISPTDTNGESSVVGDLDINQMSILIGKAEIGSFRGVNAVIESPYGYTMRGTHRSQR